MDEDRRRGATVPDDCLDDADGRAALARAAEEIRAPTPGELAALSALGDETRHRLTRLLVAADGECCVCELGALVAVGESAVSHALSDLVDADLAERRREGRWRYYRATDRAEALVAALDATRGDAADGGGVTA